MRYEFSDWPKYKPISPNGQCPFLEVSSKPIPPENIRPQSAAGSYNTDNYYLAGTIAITLEIAKRYGFAGASPREQAEVLAMVNDFDVFSYYSDVYAEKDEAKKAELKNKVRSVLETKFKLLEKKIKQTNGFIVPSGMTVADLVVFSVYDITTNLVDNTEFFKEIDEKMPILKEYRLRILNETRIQAYINSRPPLSRLGF